MAAAIGGVGADGNDVLGVAKVHGANVVEAEVDGAIAAVPRVEVRAVEPDGGAVEDGAKAEADVQARPVGRQLEVLAVPRDVAGEAAV